MRNAPLAEAGRGYDKQKFLENARENPGHRTADLNSLKPLMNFVFSDEKDRLLRRPLLIIVG
jgi:hypothetical protein